MPIIPDESPGTDGGRALAYVLRPDAGESRLIIQAGARPHDLNGAAGALPPGSVLGDFVASRETLTLIFRSVPPVASGDALTVTPRAAGGAVAGGWLPDTELPAVPVSTADRVAAVRARHARVPVPAFWTVANGRVVSGPWDGRADAAAAGGDRPGSSVAYGTVSAGGTVAYRAAPDDMAVSRAVAAALARVIDDDDKPVRATRDAVAALTVQVAHALVLFGLPVADSSGRGAPSGGVLLLPTRTPTPGVALWWAAHSRTDSTDNPAGAYAAPLMATATAAVLDAAKFAVSYDPRHGGVPLVVAPPEETDR